MRERGAERGQGYCNKLNSVIYDGAEVSEEEGNSTKIGLI